MNIHYQVRTLVMLLHSILEINIRLPCFYSFKYFILFILFYLLGRCVKYMQEGENCYSMASWQTCGCSDGLSCHYTPHPSETKRAIPPQYRPKGVHACIKSD